MAMQPEADDVPLDSEPSIEIRGVDFVTLWVRDWAKARTFYGNVLALPLSAQYEWASSSEYEAGDHASSPTGVGRRGCALARFKDPSGKALMLHHRYARGPGRKQGA